MSLSAWCLFYGNGSLVAFGGSLTWLAAAMLLMALGQILNLSVFYRLGRNGVFYGDKCGYSMPRCRAFPFSLFRHPQYVGTVASIGGFFIFMRFPHDDWFILPTVQTLFYAIGVYLEQAEAHNPYRPPFRAPLKNAMWRKPS